MRIKQPIGRWNWFWMVFGIVVLFGSYERLSYRQHQFNPSDTTIPGFVQLLDGFRQVCTPQENPLKAAFGIEEEKHTFWGQVKKTRLYNDSYATYGRLVKGFVWGCFLSIVLGILMGCYEFVESFFILPISLLAKVPGTAMLAVFFVMVGTGETMFITMIGFGVLPTLTQAIYLCAKYDLLEEEINKAYTLGASQSLLSLEIIWDVVYKKILPKLLENTRLQIGPAMVYLIAAEMLVGQVGLGYQIRMQQRLLNMSIVYDYLFILGVTGLLMDKSMLELRRWLCPWYSRFR